MIISPIFYMGCKKKLIKQGLIDLFPKKIHTLYEPFAGSAIVSMNTKADSYRLNDLNSHLQDLYGLFKSYSFDSIIEHIEKRIEDFNLARERTKKDRFTSAELKLEYTDSYYKFRDFYNQSKERDPRDFYLLMLYAFSQQFRFNSEGEFNMPCGNDCWSKKYRVYIQDGIDFFTKDVGCFCEDFAQWVNKIIDSGKLTKDDFFYFDPPYFASLAVYNESRDGMSGGWTADDDSKLFRLCDKLNDLGIRFGMSNVFYNKDKENKALMQWSEKYSVHYFIKQTYVACGKGNSRAEEVFVCNYPIEDDIFDMI